MYPNLDNQFSNFIQPNMSSFHDYNIFRYLFKDTPQILSEGNAIEMKVTQIQEAFIKCTYNDYIGCIIQAENIVS